MRTTAENHPGTPGTRNAASTTVLQVPFVPFAWLMALRIASSQTCRSFMELVVLPWLQGFDDESHALEVLATLLTCACMVFVCGTLSSPKASTTVRKLKGR